MPHFQFSPQASKYLEPPLFPSHPLSASTHITPCSMADHQALLLNLHGRSISSSSPPTTHHYRNPAKIKSRPPPRPKPSQNQIVKKKPRSPPNHKSNHTHRNQSTKPTKQPKSQNENIESEPTVKKIYIGFVIIFQKKNHLVELILDPN